jgi:hypothetical protein
VDTLQAEFFVGVRTTISLLLRPIGFFIAAPYRLAGFALPSVPAFVASQYFLYGTAIASPFRWPKPLTQKNHCYACHHAILNSD